MSRSLSILWKVFVWGLIAFGIIYNATSYFKTREGRDDMFLQKYYRGNPSTDKYPLPEYDTVTGLNLLDDTRYDSPVYINTAEADTGFAATASGFKNGVVLKYKDTLKTPARFSFCVINGFNVGKMGAATIRPRNFMHPPIFIELSKKYNNGKYDHLVTADIEFDRVQLLGKVDLSNCRFVGTGTPKFDRAELPDTLDLSDTYFNNPVDLTGVIANPAGPCYINLLHADIDKIKMQYGNLKLYFPDNIKSDPARYDEITSTYDKLLATMATHGFKDSYEDLDCEYRLWKASRTPPKGNYFTDQFNKAVSAVRLATGYIAYAWWKFGYAKERIILWTILFLIIFSAFNEAYYEKVLAAYPIDNLDTRKTPPGKADRKGIYSWLYTFIIFFRVSLDFSRINFNSRITYALIFQYLVGLVCTGFLINLIIQ